MGNCFNDCYIFTHVETKNELNNLTNKIFNRSMIRKLEKKNYGTIDDNELTIVNKSRNKDKLSRKLRERKITNSKDISMRLSKKYAEEANSMSFPCKTLDQSLSAKSG